MEKLNIKVSSEIGKLEAVIIHTPGQEVENMTPVTAERALYSDILNLSVAQSEYQQFKGVLQKHAQVFELRTLLTDVLQIHQVRKSLINDILQSESIDDTMERLMSLNSSELTRQLIEGVDMPKDNLTRFFSHERYSLRPLHNLFFTRDASITINNEVLIGKMSRPIRDRESRIMETIFKHHPVLKSNTINPNYLSSNPSPISIEGGDVLIARHDILVIGAGSRTSFQGIDFILEQLKYKQQVQHIIVQELPHSPESFIHLDMVFTFLDKDKCMVFEPVILRPNRYRTVHICIDNGKVHIRIADNILSVLKKLGIDLEPVYCGGKADSWVQEREQWHSGANFLALAPGKIMGYGRNVHTIDELNKHGFEVIQATDFLKNKTDLSTYKRYVITIDGSELARGGGGARCMSMPVKRSEIQW